MTVERIDQGIQNPKAVLTHGGDVTADLAKDLSPFIGTERARHFLFEFDHAQVPFSLIIIKRHLKIVHKGQNSGFVAVQTVKEIFGRALFRSAPFCGELSSTANIIAQGANEQAASAEEISSSIEEMTSTIQQNSENASQTEKIAKKTVTILKKFSL